jgi:hypothetical protein
MLSNFASHESALLAAIAILAVAVVLLILFWRAFIVAIVLALATFIIWHLDFSTYAAHARRFGDEYLPIPVNQFHVAHFGLGLVSGLVMFSTLFFVRPFAQAVLVAGSVAIAFILITEGISGLTQYATAILQFIKEYDFFVKGLIAGKFCAGLMKWKQVRQRNGASSPIAG